MHVRPTALAFALLAATLAAPASAALIGHPHLSASTSLGQYGGFAIGQMVDGYSGDAPFNGYASGFGSTSGRITLTFDADYDLTSFWLWNDINILNEGVRSFSLSFEDASGALLGSTGVFSAVSQAAAQVYAFAPVAGVRRVQLDVLTSSLQIEIREVAFDGAPAGAGAGGGTVPEPAGLLLAGTALAAAATVARRR